MNFSEIIDFSSQMDSMRSDYNIILTIGAYIWMEIWIIPLGMMGGWAEGLACADPGASRKLYVIIIQEYLYN